MPGERSHAGTAPVLPASPLVWLSLDTKPEVDVSRVPAFVTVIVTKTLSNEPDVVRRVETARCRQLRPA